MNEGDRFGPYRIIRQLGRGAMGDVYLADNEAGEQVALKVVFNGSDPEEVEIVEAERVGAELQKQLAAVDPRVAGVTRYGTIDHSFAIEMEYVDGEDLSVLLARGALPAERAAQIGIELCQMLENLALFRASISGRDFAGVVHGDLKPRNIRLNGRGEVKVLDFGIAKALSLTRKYTSNLFASAAYCSPERLDTQVIDMRSDLWSVGVLLYQMAAGSLPFDEPTRERLERRIRSTGPPDPMPPQVPAPYRNIVFRTLARDAAQRYPGAGELRQDLERFLSGAPVLAWPAPAPAENDATVRTAPAGEATVRTAPAGPVVVRVRGRRSRLVTGCLVAMAAGALAAAGITIQQVSFWKSADRFKHELDAEHVTNLESAWQRYQGLDRRLHLPLSLWGVRRSLKARLVGAGEEVIADYRNSENPTVRSSQWRQARSDFDHALELDPGDNSVRGRMRLCEGHLERIDAGHGPARIKHLNAAAAKFTEAADLLKRSPDPYLGLARLHANDLYDMDRAEEALRKAAEYGHPAGNREKAQLADGYRRRADRGWQDSRAFTDMPAQEKEYLERAKQDYLKAEELYQEIGIRGDVTRNRALTLTGLERVQQRLFLLEQGGRPLP